MSGNKYVLLMGSNLGDRHEFISRATDLIKLKIGSIISSSNIVETEPWGFEAQTDFLNQAVLVDSTLQPSELLDKIHEIEELLGRERTGNTYRSRTIDIDILCAEDITYNTDRLQIPHPLLHERLFALEPLVHLCPKWAHPAFGKTYEVLLTELKAKLLSQPA